MFKPATRAKSRLRLAITGPSGSGKTYGALQVAKGLGGKIAFIDTEHGSASLYSNITPFDVLELPPPYSPERFIEAMNAAERADYDTIIIDSITHEWSGKGGCLEINDQIAKAQFRGNTWSAWSVTNTRHQAFIDAILRSKCHVIACARSKTETTQTEENGRKKVTKLGMKAEQRDGIEYEFTTVLDLVHDGHAANATKDRTGLFAGKFDRLSPETGHMLLDWLNSGADPLPDKPAPRDGIMTAAETKRSGEWERLTAGLNDCHTVADLEAFTSANASAIAALPKSYDDAWSDALSAATDYCDIADGIQRQTDLDSLAGYWTAKQPEFKALPPTMREALIALKDAQKALCTRQEAA